MNCLHDVLPLIKITLWRNISDYRSRNPGNFFIRGLFTMGLNWFQYSLVWHTQSDDRHLDSISKGHMLRYRHHVGSQNWWDVIAALHIFEAADGEEDHISYLDLVFSLHNISGIMSTNNTVCDISYLSRPFNQNVKFKVLTSDIFHNHQSTNFHLPTIYPLSKSRALVRIGVSLLHAISPGKAKPPG